MRCERAREWMLEWTDGRLAPDSAEEMRAHLEGCPACRSELADVKRMLGLLDAAPQPRPSANLRSNVFAAIAAEKRVESGAPNAFSQPVGGFERHRGQTGRASGATRSTLFQALAACGLIVIGYLAGTRHATDPSTQRELTELRGKVDTMAQAVVYTLRQEQERSTTQRLEGVLAAKLVRGPNQSVIDNLIGTLALDPSANVRMSAVEALYPHADQEVVRTSILVSLPREQSPLVQLAMIDFLAASKDRDAGPVLERLSASESADPNVRDAAKRAITRL